MTNLLHDDTGAVERTPAGRTRPASAEPLPHSRLYRLDARLTTIAFYVLLAAGLAFRIYLFYTPAFIVDSDNAVVYLQTKHISEGEFTWFFWGQSYGGTLLDYIAGAAMLVFGAHIQVLSIVSTLIFVIAVFLIRHIGTQAFDRITGTVAAILFWFSGYYTLRISISEPGFYGPSLVLGLAAVAVGLRTNVRRSYLQWAIVGLLAGLAFWQSPMGAMLAVPAVVVLIIRQRSWRHLLVGAAAVVIGALPWVVQYTSAIKAVTPQGQPRILSLGTFFTELLPVTVSAIERPDRLLVAAISIGLFVLLTVLAIRQRNVWLASLVGGSVLVICIISVGAGTLLTNQHGRYAVFVMPTLAIAAAWIVTRVRFLGIVAMVVAALLTVGQTRAVFSDHLSPGRQSYILGDIPALGDYLIANRITHAFGDYWISYSVTAETEERSQVATLSGPLRYPPYAVTAGAQDPVVVIFLKGEANDLMVQAGPLGSAPGTTRTVVADYAVYTFAQPINVFDTPWALF
ncbi:glycosyltransferase family 39 protein [Subtercola sp. PAMC28395]|uniref:ArnT family glycosyltransferase n=1 Tax=Subtercola sp. PAMC28395 TaxID=2846775 RepID=UPI001C0DE1B0|nr:glycosyltransferase family 39 protein [Subtercola sp. PAMC28395]QWT25029.1 glycosyltransferase family 39 protein [Subtercola sp. PAMC28395]